MINRPLLSSAQLVGHVLQAARGDDGQHWHASHAHGSYIALFSKHWRAASQRPLVVLTATPASAQRIFAEAECLLGHAAQLAGSPGCLLLEAPSDSAYAAVIPDRRMQQRRLATQLRLATPRGDDARDWSLAVLSADALLPKVVASFALQARSRWLAPDDEVSRDELAEQLDEAGYLRVPMVEDPGTFAIRGGLIDLWPPGRGQPLRLELDGDTIASIRAFNHENQRRSEACRSVFVPPARAWGVPNEEAKRRLRERCDACDLPSAKARQLIDNFMQGRLFFGADALLPAFGELESVSDIIPREAVVVIDDPASFSKALNDAHAAAAGDAANADGTPCFPLAALYAEPSEIAGWLARRDVLSLTPSPIEGAEPDAIAEYGRATDATASVGTSDHAILLHTIAAQRKARGQAATLEPLLDAIHGWQDRGLRVIITARSHTQAERLGVLLGDRPHAGRRLDIDSSLDLDAALRAGPASSDGPAHVVVARLARGLVAPHDGIVLLTDSEIFGGDARERHTERPKAQHFSDDLRCLREGDHVVHVEHGVGRYLGLMHQQVETRMVDLLCVEYLGGDKLYLPIYRLNQLQRLRGSEASVKLDRLGGQSFGHTKRRARSRARDIADELMQLYAERKLCVGVATPPYDADYLAFEASFPHEETSDQLRCLQEVSQDLESTQPMDRLVCGDVGFGKTEVALRAAFRVAMSGRQVALLCPTTVLAQQHTITFGDRFADSALRIESLSRFQSKREQEEVVRGLREGVIDIVIGTHRLLSKDVHFQSLGLIIIDEEQRFGVVAKERLKALKKSVDVLTLTATPIPRTLQMSIGGLRDLSIIATPPQDRRAVHTIITRDDHAVLREAIERELARGGQVYFVYNRVAGLGERAALIERLVPKARVRVAHGQMSERRLETTMRDFIGGAFDVLCSTAIVENGLDIPRCNTIIIDRADRFGLAQLYQLRGRVGRSAERAYCYLVVPPAAALSADARTRVETIQRYNELGSGFQIASLDLELRGTGDLLGADQSGTVGSVGFELFCRMLDEAVHELRGETFVPDIDPELSFDVEALLPESYIDDMGIRLSLYKRLSGAAGASEIAVIGEEIEDRFGAPPLATIQLLHLMTLKTELRRLRVVGCEASARKVVLHLNQDAPLDAAKLAACVSRQSEHLRLTPDMRLTRRFSAGDAPANGLAATRVLLSEIAECVQD
jgi:transcription-repair coupling factor (superfamily II helicase)